MIWRVAKYATVPRIAFTDKEVMSLDAQFRELVSGRWRGALPAMLRGACAAAELPYRWVVRWRNLRFDLGHVDVCRVNAPVISVGNLTVGGTGKSPFVAWLVTWLRDRGLDATVISRGYGAKSGRPNDEALELARRVAGVRHLQNPNRAEAARQALRANPRQALILDDGFQHRRLARNLDIVLLDALAPFGYERLLPRGLLREPLASLQRAQVVGLSRSDAVSAAQRQAIEARVREIHPAAIWVELAHRPGGLVSPLGTRLDLAALRGKQVAAFCGIGNPAGFAHTLAQCGLDSLGVLALPDHCAYGPRELMNLEKWAYGLPAAEALVCTGKDAVKLKSEVLAGRPVWALEIDLAITAGEEALERALREAVQPLVGDENSALGKVHTERQPVRRTA